MSIILSPDCRDSNCQKCDEAAWDDELDEPATCECQCHQKDERLFLYGNDTGITYKQLRDICRFLEDQNLIPKPLPADPRERALHLRKNRNTGPDKALPGARRQYGGRG